MVEIEFVGGLQECIKLALNVLTKAKGQEVSFNDVEVKIWLQTWKDNSCGFGGSVLLKETEAYTYCIIDHSNQRCVVFHNGKFAYMANLTDKVKEAIKENKLWGVQEFMLLKARKVIQ